MVEAALPANKAVLQFTSSTLCIITKGRRVCIRAMHARTSALPLLLLGLLALSRAQESDACKNCTFCPGGIEGSISLTGQGQVSGTPDTGLVRRRGASAAGGAGRSWSFTLGPRWARTSPGSPLAPFSHDAPRRTSRGGLSSETPSCARPRPAPAPPISRPAPAPPIH